MMSFYLNMGAAIFGVLSGILWFIAAGVPLARSMHHEEAKKVAPGFVDNVFVRAEARYLLWGVRLNAAAAICTGLAGMLGGLAQVT
jgi:hypothetical protein